MKANNLTISINAKCPKNCPYCISKMTFCPYPNDILFQRNIEKAVMMASLASVNSVLISSKGEPLRNLEAVFFCCEMFKNFPLEIQTNGEGLYGMGVIPKLYEYGVNTIAISIDNVKMFHELEPIYKSISTMGMNVRVTIVLSDMWEMINGFEFLNNCNLLGIDQVTLRKLTIPLTVNSTDESLKTIEWIRANTKKKHTEFLSHLASYETPENLIRILPFGPAVYDMDGIAVTTIPYCIQESNNTEDIRSLIYHQDGHLYTSWDKDASILF
jgi:hypothetical protein